MRFLLLTALMSVHLLVPQQQSPLHWTPCANGAECTTLTVPVDWERPGGVTTTLALARRKATGPRIGTLLVNPGGPGLSGVETATKADSFSGRLRERFDVVGFDPRGIKGSTRVACAPAPAAALPRDEREFGELLASNRKARAGCADPLASHLNAETMARDVEAIRVALGGEPLNWYGTSYGTEIGQRYAELFPRHIRTMVLDAAIDRSSSAVAHLLSASADAEDGFEHFAHWCGHNADCPLHGQDVTAAFDEVVRRASEKPLLLNGFVMTAENVREFTYGQLYAPEKGWPTLAWIIAALRDAPPATQGPPPAPALDLGVLGAICQNWEYVVRDHSHLKRILDSAAMRAPHLRVAATPVHRLTQCVGLRATDAPHPLRVHGAPPILVVNSKRDPITPHSGAAEVSRQLPGSVLLTYAGDGHTTYPRSACVRDHVDSYLVSEALPANGMSCPDTMEST
ncbi:alpha/beta hydrolase [Allokutzneria albata]|nr:alpha/beta hydrolase [Allokutzneria albata]